MKTYLLNILVYGKNIFHTELNMWFSETDYSTEYIQKCETEFKTKLFKEQFPLNFSIDNNWVLVKSDYKTASELHKQIETLYPDFSLGINILEFTNNYKFNFIPEQETEFLSFYKEKTKQLTIEL